MDEPKPARGYSWPPFELATPRHSYAGRASVSSVHAASQCAPLGRSNTARLSRTSRDFFLRSTDTYRGQLAKHCPTSTSHPRKKEPGGARPHLGASDRVLSIISQVAQQSRARRHGHARNRALTIDALPPVGNRALRLGVPQRLALRLVAVFTRKVVRYQLRARSRAVTFDGLASPRFVGLGA